MSSTATFAKQAARTHRLAVAGMLSAVAFVLMYVEFPIPALIPSFIKLDVSDLPELLAAFALGPVWGIIVALCKNVLFSILHGTSSNYVGELFNFLAGSVFAFTAGVIYHRGKRRKTALLGALTGAALMALFTVPLNYYLVYPAYVKVYGMPMEAIVGIYQAINPGADSLMKCLVMFNVPFTFFKGMLDVVLCFLVYKPLSPILHR